ncbi:MAG: hypothetical protein KBT12_06540 [Bacteroidales bacterium]|nr:hypothetical protein [Candidatus Physcousia equi]
MKIKSLILAAIFAAPTYAQTTANYHRGDVNGDGRADKTDIQNLVEWLSGKSINYGLLTNGGGLVDVNSDGRNSISDLASLADILNGTHQEAVHTYVDLELLSGTLWATTNLGASSEEDCGGYLSWGEYFPKSDYVTTTYFDPNSTIIPLGTPIAGKYDAAAVCWGQEWQMPTSAQFDELFFSEQCTIEWKEQNGCGGMMFTSKKNGKTLFLPAAGYKSGSDATKLLNAYGFYWTADKHNGRQQDGFAYAFCNPSLYTQGLFKSYYSRLNGRSVRPVRAK